MGKIIGIDLGTTNSCVSVIEGGEPTVIQNAEGFRTTPSVVAFTDKNETLIGQPAKNQIVTNPDNTIYSAKRFIGCSYEEIKKELDYVSYKVLDGGRKVKIKTREKDYTPQEISARILQKMKQTAEDYLGTEVKEAVITVPAYFNDSQRQATKDAGTIAGLEVKRIVNEPTAAALAYGIDKKHDMKIAVFDLGGGTFDISILDLGEGVFEVKSTNGDTHLGGDDFDNVIMAWLMDEFKKTNSIDLRQDKMALQRLKEASEKAKQELSSAQSTDINLPFITADQNGPKHLNVSLSRAKFEQLIEPLLDRLRQPCENALKDADCTSSDIQEVILVGGSIRIPAVQEVVKKIFNKEPSKGVNPDEVVAIGAAIQGGILGGDVKDVLLLDVTPLSLGIETLGNVTTRLIERNTTIPTKKSQIFSTAADNQPAVSIKVLQGEREMSADNKTLGIFELTEIPAAPRGVPQIEVTFDIDANGILHVSAKDLGTGRENKIRIEASSGLSQNEIDQMVKEGELHSEEDKKRKELIDVKNNADSLIYQVEKTVKEHGDKITDDEKKKIDDEIKNLRTAVSNDDIDQIKKNVESLAQASQKVSEILSKEAQQNQGATGAENPNEAKQESTSHSNGENVVDTEYEVVNEDKK